MSSPTLEFENLHRGNGLVAIGVDEVGRGCIAGPVVAAAVLLPDFFFDQDWQAPLPSKKDAKEFLSSQGESVPGFPWWRLLNDSKLLSAEWRAVLASLIRQTCEVFVCEACVDEIDRLNILHASMLAMRRSLLGFEKRAQAVLVDGHLSPFSKSVGGDPTEPVRLGFSAIQTLVKGDSKSVSIAAASIVAKHYRDSLMQELANQFPGYGMEVHKGYPTPQHQEALKTLGVTVHHRRSFAPVALALQTG